jgi:hypothetical protein
MRRAGKRLRTGFALSTAVVLVTATGAFAHTLNAGPYDVYHEGDYCFQGYNVVDHGGTHLDGPDTDGDYAGYFAAEAISSDDWNPIQIGGKIHCFAQHKMPANKIGVRLQIFKDTNQIHVTQLCYDSGWAYYNGEAYAIYVDYTTTIGNKAPCGPGNYKAVGWQKVFWNGAWRLGSPTGYATDWHYFPFNATQCYVAPMLCQNP